MNIERLILASTSPFRRGLLAQAGMAFTPASPLGDEEAITAEDPKSLAIARASAKALSLADATDELVLGADQVMGFSGQALGKVSDATAAARRLAELQGSTHTLHSAYALACGGRVVLSRCVDAVMTMRPLDKDEIDAYVATGEWQGSCGCYRFESMGAHLFEPVQVDSSVIVGLPLTHLAGDLRTLGIDLLRSPAGPWTLKP